MLVYRKIVASVVILTIGDTLTMLPVGFQYHCYIMTIPLRLIPDSYAIDILYMLYAKMRSGLRLVFLCFFFIYTNLFAINENSTTC